MKELKYGCEQCDYKATQKSNLLQHVASVHEGVEIYLVTTRKPRNVILDGRGKNDLCEKGFITYGNLTTHTHTHTHTQLQWSDLVPWLLILTQRQ